MRFFLLLTIVAISIVSSEGRGRRSAVVSGLRRRSMVASQKVGGPEENAAAGLEKIEEAQRERVEVMNMEADEAGDALKALAGDVETTVATITEEVTGVPTAPTLPPTPAPSGGIDILDTNPGGDKGKVITQLSVLNTNAQEAATDIVTHAKEHCVDILTEIKRGRAPHVLDGACMPINETTLATCSKYFSGFVAVKDELCAVYAKNSETSIARAYNDVTGPAADDDDDSFFF